MFAFYICTPMVPIMGPFIGQLICTLVPTLSLIGTPMNSLVSVKYNILTPKGINNNFVENLNVGILPL